MNFFSGEILDLLKRVLTSWEVLGITAVLVAYFFLVFYVARLYRRPRSMSKRFRPKAARQRAPAVAEVEEAEIED